MSADPIALRVARRHQAAVFPSLSKPKYRVEYTNSGRISAVELRKLLEPTTGFLVRLRFRQALTGTPNTVSWEGLDKDGEVVAGKLVLHAAVGESEVVSWAEVTVDRP